MGCTNSKENTNSSTNKSIEDDQQQLLNEHFRHWIKTNRTQAEQIVLNEIHSSENNKTDDNQIEHYRPIVRKALDLVCERQDIKTSQKLGKLIQKDLSDAPPKKVSHTIDVLKQTAEKLRDGKISLETSTNDKSGNEQNDSNRVENKSGQIPSGDPGVGLKEALEAARILFYKGKQAAIFAHPNGGYDIKILDDHDEIAKEEGNLLRSIIVTEVKMRPKSVQTSSAEKTVTESEVVENFRRSIDAALKGFESIYQNDRKVVERGNVDLNTGVSPSSSSSVPPVPIISTTNNRSISKLSEADDEEQRQPQSLDRFNEEEVDKHSSEHKRTSPVETSNQSDTAINSTSHNVTYTEIIRSESRDGEQSRRIKTQSYDEQTNNDDRQGPTSFTVTTKSEFSTDPSSGEKVMEQSVQVISVKVRNEMTTNSC